MSSRILFALAGLLAATALHAQAPPFETDRPDQTETPAIVPAGWLQFEAGCALERTDSDGGAISAVTMPTTLVKVGLASWAELRLITEYQRIVSDQEDAAPVSGLVPVEVGAKIKLAAEQGLRPRMALLGHVGLPALAHEAFRPASVFGNFRFSMQHTLSARFNLGYNLGAEWDGERPVATGVYTISLGMVINDRTGAFAEAYGFLSDVDEPDNRLDTGLTYLLTDNVQLDASGGVSLLPGQWFISAGISFRAPLKRSQGSGSQ